MATTTESVRKILVGGEWYETGETLDVTSPYDGSVVAQVAFGGRADAERAVDAAARRRWRQPIPAHERAAVLDRVAGLLRERRDELARTISQEAGKPIATAQVEAERAVQTIIFSAHEARGLGGELIGMDAHPAGVNHSRDGRAPADRRRRRDLAVQLPAEPGRAQDRARVRRGLRVRPQARDRDAALGAPPGAGLRRRRAAGRVAERHRREVERDRRRPDRRPAGQADHVHRLVGCRLEAPLARGAQEGEPRARQLDAAHRDGRRRHREGGDGRRGQRLRVRRPELHLDPAGLRRGFGLRPVRRRRSSPRSRRSSPAIRSTRRPRSGRSSTRRTATASWRGSRRPSTAAPSSSPAARKTPRG